MSHYLVRWCIDIEADTPQDAARQARAAQAPGTYATVFEVDDKEFGGTTLVDVDEPDAEPVQEVMPRDVYLYLRGADHVLVAASCDREAGKYAKRYGLKQVDWQYPNMRVPGYNGWATDEEFKAAGVTVCLP